MSEDRIDKRNPAAAQDPREDYVTPTLTELGSFQELTELGGSPGTDIEGPS